MKKIILAVMSICLMLLITLTVPNAHAALIEKSVSFSVSNHQATVNDRYYRHDTSQNDLYIQLHTIYQDLVVDSPEGESIVYYDTTIKRDGVTLPTKIMRRYHSGYDSTYYSLRVTITTGKIVTFSVYDKAITYVWTLGTPGDITVSTGQLLSYQVSVFDNVSEYAGNYSLSGFVEVELDPNEGTTISDFSDLPVTTGTLTNAGDSSKVGYVYFKYTSANLFETFIIVNGEQFNLGIIDLPGVQELNKAPLTGVYWTENGKQYIYYEFQQSASTKPIKDQLNIFLEDPEQINGFRPFVTMNLTDDTYVFTDKLLLYAGFYSGSNKRAYADVVFPFELDDLLSIEMKYNYRYEYNYNWPVIGGYDEWQEVSITRVIDEVVDMRNTWQRVSSWMSLFGGPVTGVLTGNWIWDEVASWVDGSSDYTLQEIYPTSEYKNEYVNQINRSRTSQGKNTLTTSEIFTEDSDVYRVYLDTYDAIGKTNYQIADDIVVMDVMYKVDGQIYHVAYDDIEMGGSFGGSGSGLTGGTGVGGSDKTLNLDWAAISDFFKSLPTTVLIIGGIILAVLVLPRIDKFFNTLKKIIKDPGKLILYAGLVLLVLYLVGMI